jgi:signal transduction histidine kinase
MDGDATFSAVAHEVKTPLAVLRGYAELLGARDDEQMRREAVAAILEAAERLGPAIDDLLLALEIESGVIEPEWGPVDLAELVPNGTEPHPAVRGDVVLLRRAIAVLGLDSHVSLRAEDGFATITADAVSRSPLELYVAGRIVELHGGELRTTEGGIALNLPLAP